MVVEGHADETWETREERLGLPDNPQTLQRVAQLEADGWQVVSVVFGFWRFRRPKLDPN